MTQTLLRQRLQFYRNCYQAENRDLDLGGILFYAQKQFTLQQLHVIEGRELLASGAMPMAPLEPNIGKELAMLLSVYTREVQLLYGLFFVSGYPNNAANQTLLEQIEGEKENTTGRRKNSQRLTTLSAKTKAAVGELKNSRIGEPLLYYEAFIDANEKESTYQLSIDTNTPILNRKLLSKLLRGNDLAVIDTAPLPSPYVDDLYLADLLQWLKSHCTLEDTLEATQYPRLFSAQQVITPEHAKSHDQYKLGLKLIPSAAVITVERGSTSQGIGFELQHLVKSIGYSGALQSLLTGQCVPTHSYEQTDLKNLYARFEQIRRDNPDSLELWPLADHIAGRVSNAFELQPDQAKQTASHLDWASREQYTLILLNDPDHPSPVPAETDMEREYLFEILNFPDSRYNIFNTIPKHEPKRSTPYALPAPLNQAQIQALSSAAREPLSLVSGPPGTGKSYTLAALALDRYLNNETVLVIAPTQQAASVISEKLKKDMGMEEGIIDMGRYRNLLPAIKKQFDTLLKGQKNSTSAVSPTSCWEKLSSLIQTEKKQREQLEQRARHALRISRLFARNEKRTLPLWQRWLRMPLARWAVKHSVRHWEMLDDLNILQRQREIASRDYFNAKRAADVHNLLARHRDTFVRYRDLLNKGSMQIQNFFEPGNMRLLLEAFPIWVMTLNDLHRVLPLTCELFDILVIDEATQSDIASALPAFQRCRRAVVTGDSCQLRHISFLSRSQEQAIYQQHGLDATDFPKWSYRDNSLLDLAERQIQTQNAVSFLDEHFRSRPELIRFSNRMFYDGRIKIMKERPPLPDLSKGASHHSTLNSAIVLERPSGSKQPGQANASEVDRVMELLKAHIERYRSAPHKPSIGVLSPFRAQVDAIRSRVFQQIPSAFIKDLNIRVATPYGFQGEERDIMILSFAIDAQSKQTSSYLNRPDVFNVAITRAKEHQIVLFSGDEHLLPAQNLLHQYLLDIQLPPPNAESGFMDTVVVNAVPPRSHFQHQVMSALEAHGVRTWGSYPVAGQLIDIICCRDKRMLAIDLIGYPGPDESYVGIERYQLLTRAGLEMIPLSYGIWQVDQESAINAILKRL